MEKFDAQQMLYLIDKYKDKMINLIKDNDPPKELLSNYFNI